MKIDSIAAAKRIPLGTRFTLRWEERYIFSDGRVLTRKVEREARVRTLHAVRARDIVFSKEESQEFTYLTLPKSVFEPLDDGFRCVSVGYETNVPPFDQMERAVRGEAVKMPPPEQMVNVRVQTVCIYTVLT